MKLRVLVATRGLLIVAATVVVLLASGFDVAASVVGVLGFLGAVGLGVLRSFGFDLVNIATEGAGRGHAPDRAPGRAFNISRPGLFVGRSNALKRLDMALGGRGRAVVVLAVHGLGGIGKSTLVTRWAAENADRYQVAWLITADSPRNLEAGLAGLARALGLADDDIRSEQFTSEQLAERGLRWLAEHDRWLLVLDNVTDVADVEPLLGRIGVGGGRVLITSRLRSGWHQITQSVLALDVLEPAEAERLLAGIVTQIRPDADLSGAAELCNELGYLPLGIEQAAAYIAEATVTPEAYLSLFRDTPQAMIDAAGVGNAERTVARLWRINVDRLTDTPLAGEVLRILAWFAPTDIPRELLGPLAATADLGQALRRLATYHLITINDDTLAVHRLVQTVARTSDTNDPHRAENDIATARQRATKLLADALPAGYREPEYWPAWRSLLPHITALIDHADPATDTPTTGELLNRTGVFLRDQIGPVPAAQLHERALTDRQRVLGENHPDTLISRDNLANAYRAVGDLERAISLHEQTLADRQRVLGENHPNTLTSRDSLAYAFRVAGDMGRAIPMYEQNLADRQRVLGENHPDTLISRNNLANAYRVVGDLERAISLHEQTLADRQRLLGNDHPDTLNSRNNLASAYQAAGDLDRAISMYEQNLVDRQRVLGNDHPNTLTSRDYLGVAYRVAGDLDRAISLHEQTLADRQRLLGNDHPNTLISRDNLAVACKEAGDLRRAISLHEQTLADRRRVLGNDHPNTLTSRNNLALAYQSKGDLTRAIPLHEQTLIDRRRVLGEDHPDTLDSRNNLAVVHQAAGDLRRAIPLYQQTLNDCERVLGDDHPITKTVAGNLAIARSERSSGLR